MSDDTVYIVMTDCDDRACRACPDNPDHECGEVLFVTTDCSTAKDAMCQLATIKHATRLIETSLKPKGFAPVKWFELDALVVFHPREGDDPVQFEEATWFSMNEDQVARDIRVHKYSYCFVVRGEAFDDGRGNNALRFEVTALANRIRSRIETHRQACYALPNFEQVDPHWFYDSSCPPDVAE